MNPGDSGESGRGQVLNQLLEAGAGTCQRRRGTIEREGVPCLHRLGEGDHSRIVPTFQVGAVPGSQCGQSLFAQERGSRIPRIVMPT